MRLSDLLDSHTFEVSLDDARLYAAQIVSDVFLYSSGPDWPD